MFSKWPGLLLAAFALTASSRASGQQKEQFAQAQKDNAAALRQYTWKTRTEIKLKGESKSMKLEQVRYDLDGKLEKTPIDGAPAPAAKEERDSRTPGRASRGRPR